MRKKHAGFTLIELMVVIIVLSILIGIAYPAYTGQVRKARRADAQSDLQDMALQQESFRVTSTTYGTLSNITAPSNDYYNYTVTSVSAC